MKLTNAIKILIKEVITEYDIDCTEEDKARLLEDIETRLENQKNDRQKTY